MKDVQNKNLLVSVAKAPNDGKAGQKTPKGIEQQPQEHREDQTIQNIQIIELILYLPSPINK